VLVQQIKEETGKKRDSASRLDRERGQFVSDVLPSGALTIGMMRRAGRRGAHDDGAHLCNEIITCWLGLRGRRADYGCEQSDVAEHIEVIRAGWLLERDWRLPVGKAAFDLACTSC
jgi:hypothetical protein